ncbi:hypothetical protein C943_02042 [Mariniradius saccharolyticus AK6]|uniref:Uncharacterized protein n=1 Tax=Mariniradius saccharolyticus AK6 TaxID=1239962 RepID=M7Y3H2_9BACT|nr:hypothetical protein C943_02042 [Mariniradius saccharolyticus AK6]
MARNSLIGQSPQIPKGLNTLGLLAPDANPVARKWQIHRISTNHESV